MPDDRRSMSTVLTFIFTCISVSVKIDQGRIIEKHVNYRVVETQFCWTFVKLVLGGFFSLYW